MAEVLSVLYLALFALAGLGVSRYLFYRDRPLIRVWLGLAFGMLLFLWLPALFSFGLRFTMLSQLLALATACIVGGVFWLLSRKKSLTAAPWKQELPALITAGTLFLIGFTLLWTHTIVEKDGALYVGQSTYGDLAMHLGFISSIATQGTFPPMYSICPDKPVCYPFLSESAGATIYLFGTSLRFATMLTASYAFLLVCLGVYCFFEQWLDQRRKAVFSTLLFLLGGGFGFWYFFDLLKVNPDNLTRLFTAFYETPTNYVQYGLRWVNPSPNLRSVTQATLYPGVALLETTNVSVGRGTDAPFELLGAPWIDAERLARTLSVRGIAGARFAPVEFTPTSSKHAGVRCRGVRLTVTDRGALRPVALGLEIATALRDLHRADWQRERLGELLGSAAAVARFERGESATQIVAGWAAELMEFERRRARFLLYE